MNTVSNNTKPNSNSEKNESLDITVAYTNALIYRMNSIVKEYCNHQKLWTEIDLSKKIGLDTQNEILDKGFWYSGDYYNALTKFGQKKRLDYLVNNDFFYNGHLSKKYFSRIDCYSWKIKEDIDPSEAFENMMQDIEFKIIDCTTICTLAQTLELIEVLTKEKFNAIFKNNFVLTDKGESTIRKLFKEIIIKDESEIQKGDNCYFSNIDTYLTKDNKGRGYYLKHPSGSWSGLNTICCDNEKESKYLAFGLKPDGESSEDIRVRLHKAYNEDPQPKIYSDKLWSHIYSNYIFKNETKSKLVVEGCKNHKITYEEFKKLEPRDKFSINNLSLTVVRPDFSRIKTLIDAPLKKVKEIFSKFN